MNKRWIFLLVAVLAFSAHAHGPTPRKTDESVTINASVAVVWKSLSEPCSIAAWHPDIAECISSSPTKRILKLKNGGEVNEEFDEVQETEKTISYRMTGEADIRALAVSSLNGRIKVIAEGNHVKVNWTARYYRAFTGNEPPSGQDDEAAMQSVNLFVGNALKGIKAHLEQ